MNNTTMQWKEDRGWVALSLCVSFFFLAVTLWVRLNLLTLTLWQMYTLHHLSFSSLCLLCFVPRVLCSFQVCPFTSSTLPLCVCVCYLADVSVCLQYCWSPGGCWAVCVFVCETVIDAQVCKSSLLEPLNGGPEDVHKLHTPWTCSVKPGDKNNTRAHTQVYHQSMQCVQEG